MTTYPYGYDRAMLTLGGLVDRFGGPMHAEYARRLFAWIEAQHGAIGIGSAWRPTPSDTSAASRAGHSFHQDQTFADGVRGICAVDLVHVNGGRVHRSPTWSEVPAQGSTDADRWGLHANVPGEPWHLQPIELDGWQTWNNHGRPAPRAGYPIPTTHTGDDEMTPAQEQKLDAVLAALERQDTVSANRYQTWTNRWTRMLLPRHENIRIRQGRILGKLGVMESDLADVLHAEDSTD